MNLMYPIYIIYIHTYVYIYIHMYIYIYIPFLDKVDKVLGFHFEVSRGDGPSRFLQFLQTNDLQHWVSIMLKAPLSRRCMGMSKAMVFLERWSTRIAIEVLDPSRGVSGDESNHLKTFKSCHMLLDFGGLFMLSMVHKSQQLGNFRRFLPWQATELVGYDFVSPKASWRPLRRPCDALAWCVIDTLNHLESNFGFLIIANIC